MIAFENQRFVGEMKFRERENEKKKKIRKKEKKEFKFNELFVNEVARKQRVMRFEGFSRRKEARFSYLE